MNDFDRFFKVPEDLLWVDQQPVVVTVGETGGVKVSKEDGDLHATHDRQLMGLAD